MLIGQRSVNLGKGVQDFCVLFMKMQMWNLKLHYWNENYTIENQPSYFKINYSEEYIKSNTNF